MNFPNSFSMGCCFALALAVNGLWAQPTLGVANTNTNCPTGPILIGGQPDTVVSAPDAEGFRSLFDGKSLKGWWESCQSGHSNGDLQGGAWIADSTNQAISSQQKSNGAGSILMTNAKFGNYELIFDVWPDFNDDGGVFNRTTANGVCYQTTMDYIGSSSVGGIYFEAGYAGITRNLDPYAFGANENTVTTGTGAGSWTYNTRTLGAPANYGCPGTGCTPADWINVWDVNGWNQIRIKFYGTGASAANKVHMQSWFRKVVNAPGPAGNNWVPVIFDSVQYATPANYIGLQIHGGSGRWGGSKGIWYRNMKLRPLDDQGNPTGVVPVAPAKSGDRHNLRAARGMLLGSLELDHEITVSDLSGRVVERFHGNAGSFRYAFTRKTHGLLMVEVKTLRGVDRLLIHREPD